MRKLILISILILSLCSVSFAQKRLFFLKKTAIVHRAAATQLARAETPASVVASVPAVPLPSSPEKLSTVAYFHRLGNEEFWEPPKGYSSDLLHSEDRNRSLESLRLEASGLGILPLDWEKYSRAELAQFISLYKSLQSGAEVRSRFDQLGQESEDNCEVFSPKLERWVHQQPDFFETNYVYKTYSRPFHPSVKKLQVLVVNDDYSTVDLLLRAALNLPGVTVNWVRGAREAILLLEEDAQKFDAILTDYHIDNGRAADLGMYTWKKRLPIPVVFYSLASAQQSWLFKYNIVGRIGVASTPEEAVQVLNYLSNVVATGEAYPNR